MTILYDKFPIKCTYKDDLITVKILNKTLRFWCICKELPDVNTFYKSEYCNICINVGELNISKISINYWFASKKADISIFTLFRKRPENCHGIEEFRIWGPFAFYGRYNTMWATRCLRTEFYLSS